MFKPYTLLEHKETGEVVAFIRLVTPKCAAVYETNVMLDHAGWMHYEPIYWPITVTLTDYAPLYGNQDAS